MAAVILTVFVLGPYPTLLPLALVVVGIERVPRSALWRVEILYGTREVCQSLGRGGPKSRMVTWKLTLRPLLALNI